MQAQISTLQKLVNTLIEFCVNYSFQVLGAILVLIGGVLFANWTAQVVLKVCEKKKIDITLSKFLAGCAKFFVLSFAGIIALGKFGITIAPFIATLGAVAFGATYAIQGPLSNYGAGLSIILGRPFTVGNTITVAGVSGLVQEVTLANTILVTEDGVKITIPNKDIVGQILQNSGPNKVVEGVVGVSYEGDPEIAIRAIRQTLERFQEVVKNPAPQIGIQQFADSAINMGFRYWVPTTKHHQISSAVNLAVYRALQQAGVNTPFPQREVRVISQGAGKAIL